MKPLSTEAVRILSLDRIRKTEKESGKYLDDVMMFIVLNIIEEKRQ